MNFSKLNKTIYAYLGFHSVNADGQTDKLIEECLKELERISHFRYTYKFFDAPPEFLRKQPYTDYLSGSSGVIVCAMTLGAEADRRIKYYSRTDCGRAVVFDACASAYLEELSNEFERGISDNLSYRFCPGYGGSDVRDLKFIFDILQPEKVGISLTESFYMLPSKSMAGVIAVGGTHKKSCLGCVLAMHCVYKKEGTTCYDREKK